MNSRCIDLGLYLIYIYTEGVAMGPGFWFSTRSLSLYIYKYIYASLLHIRPVLEQKDVWASSCLGIFLQLSVCGILDRYVLLTCFAKSRVQLQAMPSFHPFLACWALPGQYPRE